MQQILDLWQGRILVSSISVWHYDSIKNLLIYQFLNPLQVATINNIAFAMLIYLIETHRDYVISLGYEFLIIIDASHCEFDPDA